MAERSPSHTTIKFTATALTLFMLMSTIQAMVHHVSIVNSFRSPTEFKCNTNKQFRQTYTAKAGEVYYFTFNPEDNQFWDCTVFNKGWNTAGTFRFWGDDTHGGPQLFSCVNCNWSVDQRSVFFYLDGVWMSMYYWKFTK